MPYLRVHVSHGWNGARQTGRPKRTIVVTTNQKHERTIEVLVRAIVSWRKWFSIASRRAPRNPWKVNIIIFNEAYRQLSYFEISSCLTSTSNGHPTQSFQLRLEGHDDYTGHVPCD